jgi:hypothetical protein
MGSGRLSRFPALWCDAGVLGPVFTSDGAKVSLNNSWQHIQSGSRVAVSCVTDFFRVVPAAATTKPLSD